MDNAILLAELRALANNPPDFATYTPTSLPHLQWLGKAAALLARWNPIEASSFTTAVNFLPLQSVRNTQVGVLLSVVHRAVADLELQVPQVPTQAFGPGAVYDFLKALREVLASATHSLLIIDPYLDDQIFDAYLTTVSKGVVVRLLTRDHASSLKASVLAFGKQHQVTVEARTSPSLHDRVLFVDDQSCWVLGQSIKDAARTKATYLAPLDGDATKLKKAVYEQVWQSATPIR